MAIKIAIVVVIGLVLVAVIPLFMYVSYNNQEVAVRNQTEAQQETCKAFFDKVWKIIKQQAQVAEKHKDAFKEIYGDVMKGRYGNARGGALLSFVKEHNPQFDSTLFTKLATSIEAQREGFFREQKKLIDLKRRHDNLREQIPSGWFVGGRAEIEIVVITSGKTEKTYETGEENDVDVF